MIYILEVNKIVLFCFLYSKKRSCAVKGVFFRCCSSSHRFDYPRSEREMKFAKETGGHLHLFIRLYTYIKYK